MATKTTTSEVLTRALGPDAGRKLLAYLRGARLANGAPAYPRLDEQLRGLVAPRFMSPPPSAATRRALGVTFDVAEVDRFLRFCRRLRHIKGSKWAGLPLELDLWQVVFVVAPLFGWRRADGSRLYRRLYLEVPRKNGKSTLAAAVELFLLKSDGEPGAEVYAAATDRPQARAVFDVAKAMVQASPWLSKHLVPLRDAVVYPATFSAFRVLSADAGRQHGLNVHGAVIDELHVHKSRDLIEVLETGTGSRTNPLTIAITTAGVDDPGSIYTERHDEAEKVASGELVDPELLAVIYTIDDDDDPFVEATWRKGNPGYGTSVRPEYLAAEALKAQNTPARLNTFLRLHLNRRTGQHTRWLPLSAFDASGARWLTVDEADLAGRRAFGGLDLSSSTDLTAAVLVVPAVEQVALDPSRPDEREECEVLDVVVRAWTPAATLAEREKQDRAPYARWVEEGLLRATPGSAIDYDDVERELFALADTFELVALNFDRWGSKQIVQHLADGGLEVWEMGQGYRDMSAPMKEVERLWLQGRIRTRHPMLRSALGALSVRQDPAGNLAPDRSASTGRIDVFVAFVMAVGAWLREAEAAPKATSRAVVSW